jgi:hypothetical protein
MATQFGIWISLSLNVNNATSSNMTQSILADIGDTLRLKKGHCRISIGGISVHHDQSDSKVQAGF